MEFEQLEFILTWARELTSLPSDISQGVLLELLEAPLPHLTCSSSRAQISQALVSSVPKTFPGCCFMEVACEGSKAWALGLRLIQFYPLWLLSSHSFADPRVFTDQMQIPVSRCRESKRRAGMKSTSGGRSLLRKWLSPFLLGVSKPRPVVIGEAGTCIIPRT